VAGWLSRIETELTVDEGVREEDIAGIFAAGTIERFFVITRKEKQYKTILRRGKFSVWDGAGQFLSGDKKIIRRGKG
jgi:hypothetical protein